MAPNDLKRKKIIRWVRSCPRVCVIQGDSWSGKVIIIEEPVGQHYWSFAFYFCTQWCNVLRNLFVFHYSLSRFFVILIYFIATYKLICGNAVPFALANNTCAQGKMGENVIVSIPSYLLLFFVDNIVILLMFVMANFFYREFRQC